MSDKEAMNNEEEQDNWEPDFRTRLYLRWCSFKMRWLPYRTYELRDDLDEALTIGPAKWNWNRGRKR